LVGGEKKLGTISSENKTERKHGRTTTKEKILRGAASKNGLSSFAEGGGCLRVGIAKKKKKKGGRVRLMEDR